MSLGKKIAINSLVQIIGKVLSVAVGLATMKILTNTLGVSSFGDYTLIIAFLSIFSVIADLGLNVMLTTEISHDDNFKIQKAISNILSFRIISSIIIIGILGALVAFISPYKMDIKILIIIGSFGMIITSITQVLGGLFQKLLKTQVLVIGEILSKIIFLVVVIVLLLFFQVSLLGIIIGFVLAAFIQSIYIFINSKKYIKLSLSFDFTYWKYIFKESLPLFIIMSFNLMYYKIDTIMLSIIQGPEAVGMYGVSYKVFEMLLVFPGMFVGLLLPLFTKYYHKDKKIFQHIVDKGFNTMLGLGIPVVVAGILLSQRIIELISSKDYIQSKFTLQLLFISFGVTLISFLMSHILIGSGKKNKIMIISILGAIFNIIINLFLIPRYSYTGAAIATVITEFIVCGMYIVQVNRYVGIRPNIFWNILVKIIISVILMGVSIYLLQDLPIIVTSFIAAIVFIGAIWVSIGYQQLKDTYLIQIQET
jgi:O-antigen/teichoic acid export membrane protein